MELHETNQGAPNPRHSVLTSVDIRSSADFKNLTSDDVAASSLRISNEMRVGNINGLKFFIPLEMIVEVATTSTTT